MFMFVLGVIFGANASLFLYVMCIVAKRSEAENEGRE